MPPGRRGARERRCLQLRPHPPPPAGRRAASPCRRGTTAHAPAPAQGGRRGAPGRGRGDGPSPPPRPRIARATMWRMAG
eukprot:843032-Alexandrium_andersonii.AAC.1